MKVLVIGNGGREHALTWKAAQSKLVTDVFVAPGNPGTALEPKTKNINISVNDIKALADFAENEKIDLTIVGPEAPLVAGIVDEFNNRKLKIFGPTKAAAQLEGSKSFTKDFLMRHNIPTAKYKNFTDINEALSYLDTWQYTGKLYPLSYQKNHHHQLIPLPDDWFFASRQNPELTLCNFQDCMLL